ncbi:MAG: hypothetical protein OEZ43_18620 [Gammaproteobacteria bacterium]|nr:hypothetical protein [Gammaproteobacteria bacterium]
MRHGYSCAIESINMTGVAFSTSDWHMVEGNIDSFRLRDTEETKDKKNKNKEKPVVVFHQRAI